MGWYPGTLIGIEETWVILPFVFFLNNSMYFMWWRGTCAVVWRLKDNWQELALSSYASPGDGTHMVRLGSRSLYL